MFKQLGAVNITTTSTETTLYTVPSGKETVCSGITVVNKSASEALVRMSHVPSGQSVSNEYYIKYDRPVAACPGELEDVLKGGTLAAGDVVSVYSSVAGVNFVMHGDEKDV
jgi:hypothetical protein